MISFRIIIVIFSALILLIGCNALYVNRTVASLQNDVSSLPPVTSKNCVQSVVEIIQKWEHASKLIGFSSEMKKTDRVTELLSLLYIYADHQSIIGYEATKVQLQSSLTDLSDFEGLHIDDIF